MGTNGKFRTTNGHEWTRMGGWEPRNTRKARKENPEPRMDTNGHERKTQNHEWTRMGTNGWEGTTNGHERHEREIQNHEWTRMDTNGWERTTKHTKYTKEKFRTTNGHEWTRMDTNGWEGATNGHERHERIIQRTSFPPNDLFCRQRPGGCREWRLHSIIHKR